MENLLTLQQAAQQLGVSVDVLLKWNDYHILTPKITLTGQIGYTQEQIDQFLTIQHTLQASDGSTAPFHPVTTPTVLANQPTAYTKQHASHKLAIATITAFGAAVLLLALLTQQQTVLHALNTLEQGAQPTKTQAKASGAQLGQQIAISQNQPQETFQKNIFAQPSPTTIPERPIAISNRQKQVLGSTVATIVKSEQEKSSTQPHSPLPPTDNNTVPLASVAKNTSSTQNISTTNNTGMHISGSFDQFAMVLGAGSLTNNSTPQGTFDMKNQLIFVIGMASIVLLILLRKKKDLPLAPVVATVSPTMPVEKVLEVNQKMDGTVVLWFQGKDYKISKPELDSDSDKFIERLLGLMQPGMKEIEYESLTDTIRLTTPLSRIVTRLGFVGIKRDLFFPRTSKHRVLFRKYITFDDLRAMNLNVGQLAQNLNSALLA